MPEHSCSPRRLVPSTEGGSYAGFRCHSVYAGDDDWRLVCRRGPCTAEIRPVATGSEHSLIAASLTPMQLDIWSDIACPWCYVGKRRLEAALEAFDDADNVRIRWRSFELDPNAPAEGYDDGPQRLATKYGISREEAISRMEQLTEMARADGLDLDLTGARGGNTFDGHRLVHLAAHHGLENELKERLLRAFHSERATISDHALLTSLATEVGLPPDEVSELLAGDRFADEVREDEQLAAQLGIQGVPCFVVDRKFGVTGAQPAEQLLALLDRAAAG